MVWEMIALPYLGEAFFLAFESSIIVDLIACSLSRVVLAVPSLVPEKRILANFEIEF